MKSSPPSPAFVNGFLIRDTSTGHIRPHWLEPLKVIRLRDATQLLHFRCWLSVASWLPKDYNGLAVILDDAVRQVRLAEESTTAARFHSNVGHLQPDNGR